MLSTSAFSSVVPSLTALSLGVRHGWVYNFFDLFLSNLPVEILLVICIPSEVQLQLFLGLPRSIPTQPNITLTLFAGHLSLLPPPIHSLIALKCDQQVPTQPCQSLAFLCLISCVSRPLVVIKMVEVL